jgi:hypothetical protein
MCSPQAGLIREGDDNLAQILGDGESGNPRSCVSQSNTAATGGVSFH